MVASNGGVRITLASNDDLNGGRSQMFAQGALALLVLGLTPSPDANHARGLRELSPRSEVVFNGPITTVSAADLVVQLRAPLVTQLIITSEGGDEGAALDIADIIMQRGIDVTVRGRCVSACANTILVAGSKRRLESRAVVAFHHSAPTIERNYIALARPVPEKIAIAAERVRALYRDKDADLALLECAASKIELTLQQVEAVIPGEDRPRLGWLSRHRFWVPQDGTLARFGIDLERIGARPSRRVAERALNQSKRIVMGEIDDCP